MKLGICLSVVVLVMIGFSGCARMELSKANLSAHVQLNTLKGNSYQIKKHFKEKRWNHYFLFQLAPTARPKIHEMIGHHVAPGDIVVDLEVKKKTTFINGFICALVGIIYCPDTLTIEGNVATPVKAK